MARYRFYWIGTDGHIKGADIVECSSDDEARTVAIDRKGKFPAVEVWLDGRFVVRVGAPERTPKS